MNTNNHKIYLMRDLGIIALSIIIAIILAKTEIIDDILNLTKQIKFLDSFVAGIFFVSIFTTAPATVVLAKLAESNSIWSTALFGGLGALVGDYIIFRFIKNTLAADILLYAKEKKFPHLAKVIKSSLFRWLMPILGAIIIASPLPDELGLAMMGVAKTPTSILMFLSFLLNFLGILIIGLIAKHLI